MGCRGQWGPQAPPLGSPQSPQEGVLWGESLCGVCALPPPWGNDRARATMFFGWDKHTKLASGLLGWARIIS